ncbi:hypothetical protein D4740_05715 [Actinomyces sp. 2119]|uniref:Uncharacterized protein n=1 Tax=Actinomyces lilanjuaniae TaxID=2321394 RepID=A0ABN5PNL0_9ACTO|nr:hypothetical protein D5R93_07920 [Actinomyces lilanjuaniae]RJF42451.1 hypothetical protein D4740_05715 [Actinomyces sp. 2119]
MPILLDKVNSDPALKEMLQLRASRSEAPVLATPAALAWAAGAALGGGSVGGAAYAAYRAVAN